MTESPQQPGYDAAQQQQQQQQAAAYAQQQQAYAAQQQAYAQPAPNMFDKLPMNMLTFGLAAGGLLVLLLGVLLGSMKGHAEGSAFSVLLSFGSTLLSIPVAIIVLAGIAITTGEKFRNTFRALTAALTVVVVASAIGSMIDDGMLESQEPIVKVGVGLVIVALCLFTTATFTMSGDGVNAVDPAKAQAVYAQQQAQAQAQQQAAAQQHAQQQQYATQQIQQAEPQTSWQQQPPAQ